MKSIQLLDEKTINKIAAGEVVERPASVVKELVENSIDAGSSAITVEIKEGGISFIRVTDNGVGISHDQIKIAFLRHCTSKISKIDDLLSVFSLGFRGEALASIAAVAQVEMITKTSNSLTGSRFVIEGGVVKNDEEIGCPEGTTLIMRNLFFNTPVRKNFLKKPASEAAMISDVMNKLALGHPEISFKYIKNNSVVLHTSGNNMIKNSIFNIYGKQVLKQLIEIEEQHNNFGVKGYISKPQLTRGNRTYQSFFINGRYIKSKLITRVIENVYKDFIPQRQYPIIVLHIRIQPSEIDVNVHPNKMEVRFHNEETLYKSLYEIIYHHLKTNNLIPKVTFDNKPIKDLSKNQIIKEKILEPFEIKETKKVITTSSKGFKKQKGVDETVQNQYEVNSKPIADKIVSAKSKAEDTTDTNNKNVKKQIKIKEINNIDIENDVKPVFKIIGQLFKTYWIIEKDKTMLIIDQHAAHERIMFEKFKDIVDNGKKNSQILLNPYVLNLSDKENVLLKDYIPILIKMGFEIETFGNNSYIVRSTPFILNETIKPEIILDIIDMLEEKPNNLSEDILINKISSMACKAAVKGNQSLTINEVKELLEKLFELENPYNCPHGRPTIIAMTQYELERKFKRT